MGDMLDISFLLDGGALDAAAIERLRGLDLQELKSALATYLGDDEIEAALERAREILGRQALAPSESNLPVGRTHSDPEPTTPPEGAVEISVLADPAEVADRAADLIVELAAAAIAARRRCSIALSGGSTPKLLHQKLAARGLPWDHLRVLFSDERAVPPTHPDSNFKMAEQTLFGPAQVPMSSVFRIEADDGDAERAARTYGAKIEEILGPEGAADIIILGMGEDGHTASLFPGRIVGSSLVVATEAPESSPVKARVSFSYEALRRAREVLVLITGSNKAARTAEVLSGDSDLPIARVLSSRVRSRVLCDRDAASQLGKPRP